MNQKNIKVLKSNGEMVDFMPDKLKSALMRSGADAKEAESIVNTVISSIGERTKTGKIYKIAYNLLKQKSKYVAGRFRLKQAVYDLGPSGYPFEKYVSKLLEYQGYKVKVNIIENGACVKHELDVVAENNEERLMIECKFHRDKGHKNDVKIPLYIHSRFLDIKASWEKSGDSKLNYFGMIVTNTRFSEDATEYGKCTGMRLVSWDYPHGNSLKDWIDRADLHPITSMNSLTKLQRQSLLDSGVVLCKEIVENHDVLLKLGLRLQKRDEVIKEAEVLSGS
ncbi:MAG: hypothetical protein AUJ98_04670 [Bacteroidetes bacterium CG2_30_33_31]|nr:MAG: hypothetical protein AUJ98_04670 [Bacteroidetes bacterium CG2_30_33_31]